MEGGEGAWSYALTEWRVARAIEALGLPYVIASDPPTLAARATAGYSPPKRGARRRKRSNLMPRAQRGLLRRASHASQWQTRGQARRADPGARSPGVTEKNEMREPAENGRYNRRWVERRGRVPLQIDCW